MDGRIFVRTQKMRKCKVFLSCVLLISVSGPLPAVEVYTWVDANGVVHFSQWAPAEPVADLTIQSVDGARPPNSSADEDVYAVSSTAEQTQAVWDDIAQRREERRVQRQSRADTVQQPYAQAQEYVFFPYQYPKQYYRPPNKSPRPRVQPLADAPTVPFRRPRN